MPRLRLGFPYLTERRYRSFIKEIRGSLETDEADRKYKYTRTEPFKRGRRRKNRKFRTLCQIRESLDPSLPVSIVSQLGHRVELFISPNDLYFYGVGVDGRWYAFEDRQIPALYRNMECERVAGIDDASYMTIGHPSGCTVGGPSLNGAIECLYRLRDPANTPTHIEIKAAIVCVCAMVPEAVRFQPIENFCAIRTAQSQLLGAVGHIVNDWDRGTDDFIADRRDFVAANANPEEFQYNGDIAILKRI